MPLTSRPAASILLLILNILSWFPAMAQPSQSPNILLILADDLGYGDLSSYGADDIQTPNIDSLVEQGMKWDFFYANSPVCSPTRAALLTGRYPERVGVPGVIRTHFDNNWGYLSPEAVLLPQMLKRNGYHTGMSGKWHLGLEPPNVPSQRGFDEFRGFLGDMMDDYFHHRRHGINYMRHNDQVINPEGHATDLFSSWAADYIRRQSETEAPFFLYLAYNAPHSPIQPPDEWLERIRRRSPELSDERARFVALTEHMDAGVGQVLEALRETGQKENTLVIFVSDNGGAPYFGSRNGELRGGKQDLYEGGIRVPAVFVWPKRIESGSRSSVSALTMDLYSTICDAAGVPITHVIDGVSILPILQGTAKVLPDRPLFWTRREGGERYMGQAVWAVRQGHWKLLQNNPMQGFELYNLEVDPLESQDVKTQEEEIYSRLGRLLRRHLQRSGETVWQRPFE